MPDTSNRTFVCSVLFLDIVEYSKKPVTEQLALKQRFNALLLDAMRHVAAADRIVLDTGDGAAVSFLGNPEDCLFAAMSLRDGITAEGPEQQPALRVRMGINLGPVRLIRDINGQMNIIGDGINVAQRVMSFADPGTILVSRSYYEVVSCLSQDFSRLFQYEGTHTDKHVREHSVYAISPGTPGIARPTAATGTTAPAGEQTAPDGAPAASRATHRSRKPLMVAAAAAVALIGAALLLRMERKTAPPTPPAAEAAAEEPKSANAPAEKKKTAEPRFSVQLAILPWGEVFVDGQKKGVSPPLKTLTLSPGPHRVEVRNADFAPYVTTVEATAGGKARIQHKF
ncbi:MAG: adenylate/guanylate cyclase domain-containing protein [Ignavibacteria bacterium]